MKVLITGGCGYIGYSLLRHLLFSQDLEEVILYDNLFRRNPNFFLGQKLFNQDKVKFVQGDILDNYTLEKSLEGIDTVVHLAAKVSTPFSDNNSHQFDQVNNWGTASIASAVERSPNVKTLMYVSSISVYGNTKGTTVNEDAITVPKSFYGVSKLNGEKHIKRLSNKLDTYIFRTGNVFGFNPCIRLDAVINRLMFDAQYKGKIEIHGHGDQKRAFASVNCIGQYLSKICFNKPLGPGLYNLVNYNLSVNEIVEKIKILYPELEMIFLDQHLEMRSISAETKHDIDFQDCFNEFEFHLKDIKSHFSF